MFIIRSLTLAAALVAALAAITPANAQEKKVRVIPLTPAASAASAASAAPASACTPAAAEMKAAIAACGSGEVKATPAHKLVVKRPPARPRVVVRTVVKKRVVYRDRLVYHSPPPAPLVRGYYPSPSTCSHFGGRYAAFKNDGVGRVTPVDQCHFQSKRDCEMAAIAFGTPCEVCRVPGEAPWATVVRR